MYILLLNRLECHSRALWDSKKRVDFVSDITVGGRRKSDGAAVKVMSQFSFCDLRSQIPFPPLSFLPLTICPVVSGFSFEQWYDRSLIGSRSLLLLIFPTDDAYHKFPYHFQLEGEKSQGTSLQREIQGLQENVVDLQKKTERLQHDLGSKDSQNMWLQV